MCLSISVSVFECVCVCPTACLSIYISTVHYFSYLPSDSQFILFAWMSSKRRTFNCSLKRNGGKGLLIENLLQQIKLSNILPTQRKEEYIRNQYIYLWPKTIQQLLHIIISDINQHRLLQILPFDCLRYSLFIGDRQQVANGIDSQIQNNVRKLTFCRGFNSFLQNNIFRTSWFINNITACPRSLWAIEDSSYCASWLSSHRQLVFVV